MAAASRVVTAGTCARAISVSAPVRRERGGCFGGCVRALVRRGCRGLFRQLPRRLFGVFACAYGGGPGTVSAAAAEAILVSSRAPTAAASRISSAGARGYFCVVACAYGGGFAH